MQTNSYWIRNSGSTPSTGTGPTGDATTGMLICIPICITYCKPYCEQNAFSGIISSGKSDNLTKTFCNE